MNNIEVIKVIHNPSLKKKVCGYARVSTADEHQDSSYRMQIFELEKSIRANPNYEFIGVFKDRKSAKSIEKRGEFNAMIELATLGEIDVIVTKSVTRFARNLIDTINVTRSLKNHGVEVIFQKENISSSDSSIELYMNILAMHAEEELRNISENTNWSIQRKIKNGGNLTTYLYGYDIKGETWTIKPKEANVVRLIFEMYVEGISYKKISEKLYSLRIKTATGKDRWSIGTLQQTVQNEKYAGHMALCKTFVHDGSRLRSRNLVKKSNTIYNHHEPIISQDLFDKAISLRESRTRNSLTTFVPYKERVSIYHRFVYSIQNSSYLTYVVEKPKGKYEIPTLFCYSVNKTNRVMITIKNLFAILNDGLNKLSKLFNDAFENPLTPIINDALYSCENELKDNYKNKAELLKEKVHLLEAKRKIASYTKMIKSFKDMDNIDSFKTLVRNVEIINPTNIRINLGLVSSNYVNKRILKSSITLRVGNGNKDIIFFIYI